MADRPMPFSAPMVQALLDGRKTQTRRILKPQPVASDFRNTKPESARWFYDQQRGGLWIADGCAAGPFKPAYAAGDRLWVREGWRPSYGADWYREDLGRVPTPRDFDPARTSIEYLADGTRELGGQGRPSIHMPRWASRLTLFVTDVKVERLQDISEEDARAEGCFVGKATGRIFENATSMRLGGNEWANARDWFADLWDSINGFGAWDANPWVVAVSFTVHRCNIDQMQEAA